MSAYDFYSRVVKNRKRTSERSNRSNLSTYKIKHDNNVRQSHIIIFNKLAFILATTEAVNGVWVEDPRFES